MERCILKVSTSSVAVGTDDMDGRRSGVPSSTLVEVTEVALPDPFDLCRSSLSRCYNRLPDSANAETNAAVLKRRQKQIQYGKNTSGYQNYLLQVPK